MKLYKKIVGLAIAGAMTISGLSASLPVMTAPLTAQAADDTNDDWLHAEGSKLYDMNGNQVWLTGANWFGFNCTENFPHGLWSADADALLSTVADHGVNCINRAAGFLDERHTGETSGSERFQQSGLYVQSRFLR